MRLVRSCGRRIYSLKSPSNDITDDHKLQLLIDSIVDYAIYMIGLDGDVLSLNLGARRLKGYAPEEILGRSFENFYTPEDRAVGMPKKALAIARDTGRFN